MHRRKGQGRFDSRSRVTFSSGRRAYATRLLHVVPGTGKLSNERHVTGVRKKMDELGETESDASVLADRQDRSSGIAYYFVY
jgi:hypothetical protein